MKNLLDVDRVGRILSLLLLTTAFAASLLVFPSALLWMVAGWLSIASWRVWRDRAGWLPLLICVTVIAFKRPDWSPALILLTTSMVTAAIIVYWLNRWPAEGTCTRRVAPAAISIVWLVWLTAMWESHETCHAKIVQQFDTTRPIVCVGDSLTTGLGKNEAYPDYLQKLVSIPVVNFGRAGVTAQDSTKHRAEILDHRPQAVVIELGGHDFLRGYGRDATRASLVQIIEASRAAGAAVVLVEIPRGFITDPYSGLERELAREYDLELIPDSAIRMLVVRSLAIPIIGELAKPHWSDDGLHPNAAGAQMLADTVFRTLRRMYGPSLSVESLETPPAGE